MAGSSEAARDDSPTRALQSSGFLRLLTERLGEDDAARIVATSADVALVVDGDGIICEVACNGGSAALTRSWRGQPWIKTVSRDSQDKVAQLLRDATSQSDPRWREVYHHGPNGTDVPIRYSAMPLGRDGFVFAIGRDLRELGRLQERMVDTQRSLDLTAKRLRNAEARYRVLFDQSREALLIVDPATGRVLDANPAVGHLAGLPQARVVGRPLGELFHDTGLAAVHALVHAVRVSGRPQSASAQLKTGNSALTVTASAVRVGDETHLIVRLVPPDLGETSGEQRRTAQVLSMLDRLPFGFVATDGDLRIFKANRQFLDEIGRGADADVRGELLTRWLGRRDVEVDEALATLRRTGASVDFSTLLRGPERSAAVAVTVVGVPGEAACFGFVIRTIARGADDQRAGELVALPRSGGQLAGLLGRMPLKDIINEAVACIEKLSIEAALRKTRNNRASAAQLLGLSRQSLYVKLRRYGLAGYAPGDDVMH